MPEPAHPKVYGVSELTREIQDALEHRFDTLWVEGEVSSLSTPVSGHCYMVLKDQAAQIRAVMFRMQMRTLRFALENGMKVLARGRIGVYAPRGEYQLILAYLEPLGTGTLALALLQLKRRLAEQGLFDQALKRPLPFLPRRVALITSPTGAAVRDFLKIVSERFANLEILVVPVRVQGAEATDEVVEALAFTNREGLADVVVITRGGGSLEDLWPFNEERLALAVRRSRIPVVSAVGHEIDWTLCDLAADLRAPTPSAAAQMVVAEKEVLARAIRDLGDRLLVRFHLQIRARRRDLEGLKQRIREPRRILSEAWQRMDELEGRMRREVGRRLLEATRFVQTGRRGLLAHAPTRGIPLQRRQLGFLVAQIRGAVEREVQGSRSDIALLSSRLEDLNPLSILKRGYSITRSLPGKRLIRDAEGVSPGQGVHVQIARGALVCRVEEVEP